MRPSPARRVRVFLGHVGGTLGWHGLTSGVIALIAFGFGLTMLVQEVRRPRQTEREVLHRVLVNWAKAPDYLGRNLIDDAIDWRSATESDRLDRLGRLAGSLRRLGQGLERFDDQFPLVTMIGMDLRLGDGRSLAAWAPRFAPGMSAASIDETIPLVEPGRSGELQIGLDVRYQVAPEVESVVAASERYYNQLIRALIGLSGTSLLCFGYMVLHVLGLRDRVAREAAQEATLDLADRTCHELGNVAFVVSNERRNLAAHIDLLDRFVAGEAEARAAAARRAGLEPGLASRLDQALGREYAAREIDPAFEIRRSVAMARDICRQIAVCSDYIALTVRELDGFLKGTDLPVSLGPIPVGEVIDEAIALLSPRIEAADASVERPDPAGASAWVVGDRRLLVHALVNLLKNAVEAASSVADGPSIRVSARREGETVWIEVADNGPGFPSAGPGPIFEDGYSSKGVGRGQGLAIVRESITLQGGRIEADNRPGGGAAFAVGLPVADPRDHAR